MSKDIVVDVDVKDQSAVLVDKFHQEDTDRARISKEIERQELDKKLSTEAVQNLSVHVSQKLLEKVGLDDEYGDLFEKKRVGFLELKSLGLNGLEQIGIKDPLHRGIIAEAAKHKHIADAPANPKGGPLEVRVKMGFARLSDINTVAGTVNVKLFVDLYWNDPRLVGVLQDQLPEQFMWQPDAYFYNSIDRTGENGGHVNEHDLYLMDSETGLMLKPMEIEIVCSVQMDLKKFPFDENRLKLHLLQSEDSNAREWVFAPAKDMASCIKFFYNTLDTPEFDLTGYSMDFFTGIGGNGMLYSNCALYVYARRRPLFYLWKLVVPLVLTTMFAFTVFFFPINELEARSNTSQTTLLTTVALLYVIAQELPKMNYLTKIDIFVVFCLAIQLMSWVLSCLYTFVDDTPEEIDAAQEFDLYLAIIIPTTYFLVTLVMFIPPLIAWYRKEFEDGPSTPLIGYDKQELEYYPLAVGRNIFP